MRSVTVFLAAVLIGACAQFGFARTPANDANATSPPPQSPATEQSQAPAQTQAPSLAPLPSAPGATPPATEPGPNWHSLFNNQEFGALNGPANQSGQTQNQNQAPPSVWDPFANDPFFQHGQGTAVYDPWRMLHDQMEEMRQIEEQMMQGFNQSMPSISSPGSNAQVFSFSTSGGQIEDKGDHYEIALELSGLDHATTNLNVEGNTLVLRCVQHQQATNTGPGGATASSTFTNNIERHWSLPTDADRGNVSANFQGDTLLITVPKVAGAQTTIPVPIH
jgi:HSP20 family molecular chaperone IbpA